MEKKLEEKKVFEKPEIEEIKSNELDDLYSYGAVNEGGTTHEGGY